MALYWLMRLPALLFACAFVASNETLAATKIQGTSVSYQIKSDPLSDGNTNMVFIDAQEDDSGKTYMSFVCEVGYPWFRLYSKVPLAVQAEIDQRSLLSMSYRADNNAVGVIDIVPRADRQTHKLSVLYAYRTPSSQMLRVFLTAMSQVVVRINRINDGTLTYTFPVRGFRTAFQKIKSCN